MLTALVELHAATTRSGLITFVTGEAGMGKTSLVGEFVTRLSPRSPVYWGGCDPLGTPRPLGPWYEIAAQAGLAPRIEENATREAFFAGILDVLETRNPVVVLEDVHWADEATLDLLIFVGRRVARSGALLVATYRDDEVDSGHPLRAARAVLPRDVTRQLPLAALSADAVTAMAERSARDPAGIHAMTGGNPLLVTEILAADQPGVPGTVRDLVEARLRGLSPTARETAHLVSVIPARANVSVLSDCASEVAECLSAGVLISADNGVAFRHDLLRQAVHDALSPTRRAALHTTVLSRLTADSAEPAQLAHHAERAGDIPALLQHAPIAARRAAGLNAHREATAHLRSILPHLAALPTDEQATLLDTFGIEAFLAGDPESGLPALRQALKRWEQLDRADKIGENLRWTSRLAWWLGHRDDALTAAIEAVDVLEALPPSRELALAYGYRSLLDFLLDDPDEAIAWGEKARTLAHRVGDHDTEVHARGNIAVSRLRFQDVHPYELDTIVDDAVSAGLVEEAERALVNLAAIAVEKFDPAAPARADQALRYALDHDLYGYAQYSIGVRAGIRLEHGDWDGARADAQQSLDWTPQPGLMQIPALVALGRLQARTGDPAAVATLDIAATLAYRTEQLAWVCPVAIARSEAFWLAGDLSAARDEAQRGLTLATGRGHIWFAGALAWRALQAGQSVDVPAAIDPIHRALIDGDWNEAAQQWGHRGFRYARAEALIHGDEPAAAEAMHLITGLGATPVARRWRAQLRERGARVPRRTRASAIDNPSGLTTQQLAVLELIAEGLTNAEIARRLSLTVKTVANHASAAFAKLGVSGRVQAAAVLRFGSSRTGDPKP